MLLLLLLLSWGVRLVGALPDERAPLGEVAGSQGAAQRVNCQPRL